MRLVTAQVLRGKEVVHEGNIVSLRRVKDDVKDVAAGLECGVGVADFAGWKEGDRLEVFQVEQKQRNTGGGQRGWMRAHIFPVRRAAA